MSKLSHINTIRAESKGITLTELLVASVMIGVVMVGVASFSLAIKSLQQSTSRSALVALKAKSVMARITKDASLAVGHELDRGIVRFPVTGDGTHLSICFRHDLPETPEDYNDDTWACYYRNNTQNDLLLCGPRGAAGVPVTDPGIGAQGCANGGDQLLLGLDSTNSGDNVFNQIIENSGNRLQYVEITINTLYNETLAFDPITNPRYTATTQISPAGHSR